MADERDDGGPAFPVTEKHLQEEYPGMTLRQWYAGMAMQGMLSDRHGHRVEFEGDENAVAHRAFACADAMLAHERRERGGGDAE